MVYHEVEIKLVGLTPMTGPGRNCPELVGRGEIPESPCELRFYKWRAGMDLTTGPGSILPEPELLSDQSLNSLFLGSPDNRHQCLVENRNNCDVDTNKT